MAWAAAVADTPASKKVTGLSGEVMDTSNAAFLPKKQLGSKNVRWTGLAVVSDKIVANFHLNPYVSPTTGLHQDVPNPIMAGDHITTILAGNCMVAKVIKCTTWAQCTLGALQGVKSKPPFDGNLENWWIHVKPQKGTTCI